MSLTTSELDATVRLAIAALIGLGVGLEREWSGHASGDHARFAGLRTLFMLGLVGGVAGLLLADGRAGAGAAMAAGAMALAVAAYVVATRKTGAETDGTTEAAAMAVVALGAVAGTGWIGLAAGAGSVVVLALSEKTRLHALVRRAGERELRAAMRFAVLALVVLPLLPPGPYGGILDVRPRALWAITLFMSGLSFAGNLARRAVGPGAGYAITGALGGMISSTAVTLEFSRRSRRGQGNDAALALGVVGACTVLIPRVVVVSSVLAPAVGMRVAAMLAPAAVAGALAIALLSRLRQDHSRSDDGEASSPLRLKAAAQMAVAFQVAVSAVALARAQWGGAGFFTTAALLGLTDVDALTASMSRASADAGIETAAIAVAVGILANTALKVTLALVIGRGRFRMLVAAGLVALGVGIGVGLLWQGSVPRG